MYKIDFNRTENPYELTEMVRMFLPNSAFEIIGADAETSGDAKVAGDVKSIAGRENGEILIRIPDGIVDKNDGKRYLYEMLSQQTGYRPDWGILTGIRPVKLAGELIGKYGSFTDARHILMKEYLLSEEKAELLLFIRHTQAGFLEDCSRSAVGLYIGIPFCPTRCLYCSFPSYQIEQSKVQAYLQALYREMKAVGDFMKQKDLYAESIYIGGGTPTSLYAADLDHLLGKVKGLFQTKQTREFTVEAGRPDTITAEKLSVIMNMGVDRISINPQSMKQETLKRIGRDHSPEDVHNAFRMAREAGIQKINADVIAGLPGEQPEDFLDSLKTIMQFNPENITVHTLAVKRASRLKEEDREYSYRQGVSVQCMLDEGARLLKGAGYRPYYLYRQKQMAGNLENTGYALPGYESIYNIKIMEENQTIIAMGAGGITKIWFPQDNRLLRIPNVSNYEIYIERIEEMILRKRKGIFE